MCARLCLWIRLFDRCIDHGKLGRPGLPEFSWIQQSSCKINCAIYPRSLQSEHNLSITLRMRSSNG